MLEPRSPDLFGRTDAASKYSATVGSGAGAVACACGPDALNAVTDRAMAAPAARRGSSFMIPYDGWDARKVNS